MPDLLMAVGTTKMRWRGQQPNQSQETAETTRQMQMMEFAFRMGQQANTGSSSSTPGCSKIAPRPLLALEDAPREPVQDTNKLGLHICRNIFY
jgi:hypothetical protein